jgi:GDP-D-mannose dehydratase
VANILGVGCTQVAKGNLYAIFVNYVKAFGLLAIVSVIRNVSYCGEDKRYVTKNTASQPRQYKILQPKSNEQTMGFFKAIS